MPVPCFFTHCGGNQHVSFTLDLWWWPGRKLMGRTPAWKINCAHLVSASGEILHLELEKGGEFYLISAKQQHMLSIFFLQFCLGRDDVGKCSDVVVFLWKYIYTYVCVAIYFGGISGALWVDELCCRWEQKHFCQPQFGRRDMVDLCCTMSFTDFNFITTRTIISKSALPVAACSRCTLKYWGLFWVGITLL